MQQVAMSLLTMHTVYRSILIRCSGRHHSNQGNQAETGESVHREAGAMTGTGGNTGEQDETRCLL